MTDRLTPSRGPSPIVRLPNGDAILASNITGAFAADADRPSARVIVAHGDHRDVIPCETFEDACAARDAVIEQWEAGLRRDSSGASAGSGSARDLAAEIVDASSMVERHCEMVTKLVEPTDLSEIVDVEAMRAGYREIAIDVFVTVYTADELRGLLDFRTSPFGASFFAKEPRATRLVEERVAAVADAWRRSEP